MDGWTDKWGAMANSGKGMGWVGECVERWMNGWRGRSLSWVCVWVGRRMDGWMAGWMDG